MPKRSSAIGHAAKKTGCPDCGRPFDPAAQRHTIDSYVNRFLIPACCTSDYRAANPKWKPTRPVHATKKKPKPYASESLAVSRRMVAPGPLHEERSIIYDLMTRFRHLQSTLPYYDRKTGEPIAAAAETLRQETWRRIKALPQGELRTNLTREMYQRS